MIEQLLKYYSKAKRTALLAEDKLTGKWYHIFSVFELLSEDIEEYNIPNNDWYENSQFPNTSVRRSTINSDAYTFYLIIQDIKINDALSAFDNPLENNSFDGKINEFFNNSFIKEPTGELPLVLPSNMSDKDGLSSILPKRNSGLLVWTQIDNERKVEKLFKNEPISKQMEAINQLTEDWLGFDIWFQPEHLGNIYLSLPNPYFRDIDLSISQNPVGIYYHFKIREGIKEIFKIRIIDKHGDNIALDRVYEITNYVGRIDLPHEPEFTEFRIYNSSDDLIAKIGPFGFLKTIQFGMSVKQADFHVKIEGKEGEKKEFVVEKFSREKPLNIGKVEDFNAPFYFKTAENKRKHIYNKEMKNFIFFKGGLNNEQDLKRQKEEAKTIISEIINKAKNKCYICDPYFDANDLIEFAFPIKNSYTELRILNSNECINKDIAKTLLELINRYNEQPFQKIELKVLYSHVLHDRFIVADNEVWYLGTSLNQFGTKTTCIGKVPESDNLEIIKEIERWFNNIGNNYSMTLEEYANSKS
jgi:hypothetical protein